MPDWEIYTGSRIPHDDITTRLPSPPPWRRFTGTPTLPSPSEDQRSSRLGMTYLPSKDAIRQVNAALYLRRPLLVTGPPGTAPAATPGTGQRQAGLLPRDKAGAPWQRWMAMHGSSPMRQPNGPPPRRAASASTHCPAQHH
jgi:hypothetical protein